MNRPNSTGGINTLVVATTNAGKLNELRGILPPSTNVVSLSDLSIASPEESGTTFLANAILKAVHASRRSGLAAIADDSGLEVDVLSGQPGVFSARYAGEDATDAENNRKLLDELNRVVSPDRRARFVCAVAFHDPSGLQLTAIDTLDGEITDEARGNNGFGYDPHFLLADARAPEFNGSTLAELSTNDKNQMSHRRRAIDRLVAHALNSDSDHPAIRLLAGYDREQNE